MKQARLVFGIILVSLSTANAATPLEPLPEDHVSMIECQYGKDENKLRQRYKVEIQKGTYHYRVYVPKGYNASTDQRYPCLFIHSPGGNAGMDNVKTYAESNRWLVVMLVESQNGPSEPCVGNFLAAHDDAVLRFRIMEGKKVVTGFSGGAREASNCIGLRPGFLGVILQGAGFAQFTEGPRTGAYKVMALEANKSLLVYASFGENDSNRSEITSLQKTFPKQTLRVFKMFPGGHQWAPAENMQQALDWMQSRHPTPVRAAEAFKGLR